MAIEKRLRTVEVLITIGRDGVPHAYRRQAEEFVDTDTGELVAPARDLGMQALPADEDVSALIGSTLPALNARLNELQVERDQLEADAIDLQNQLNGAHDDIRRLQERLQELTARPQPASGANITARQLRLALHQRGRLQEVEPALSSLPEPQKGAALIEWEYATEFRRDHPLVVQVAGLMGLSPEETDQWWAEARAL